MSTFIDFDIVHQRSCTYTPQQNGGVKRKHRHLAQVARALFFNARLSKDFWGEAMLTVTRFGLEISL